MSRRKKGALSGEGESGIIPPNPDNENVVDELKNMRVLTPYTVASCFNLRLSAARDLLEQLENRGVVEMVSGHHTLKIYKSTD